MEEIDVTAVVRRLRDDPALRYNNVGRTLLAWLAGGPAQCDVRTNVVGRLPPHCLDAIIDVARSHAAAWQQFVEELEVRRRCLE